MQQSPKQTSKNEGLGYAHSLVTFTAIDWLKRSVRVTHAYLV